ncbi:putative Atrazine chlorohydrolase [Paratrimastix pyriformis]|uniref:Atrazine chlorohydrolase n=1 Tax=Paratrimastix pyriformis TaxID=342808 RepID=A0ABQ8U9P2_9EUKA|nr:putative Atrazine chlorohydrolase [Paratrimastix pyriformis]
MPIHPRCSSHTFSKMASPAAPVRPMPKTQFMAVRADYVIPMSETPEHTRDTRLEDGYVLIEGAVIREVGQYTHEIGQRILRECGHSLTIVGGTYSADLSDLPKIRGCVLPGFVKAHGHDHEATIIGLCKDVPLTQWLDGVINVFTGFLNEKREELTRKFRKSPNLVAYRKARLDDIYYGITTSLVHHCNFNKYHVPEIVEANVSAGTKMIIAVGSQDRNYDPRILDIPAQTAVDRLDDYYRRFNGTPLTWVIPGPDQVFSNGPELLRAQKQWAREHGTLIHIHSAEERNTTHWFREKYGRTEIEYLKEIGFLDSNTMLAHQVHSTDGDLELIRATGTNIVHNPLANTILGSGMPNVIKMLQMGIPVAISTDGSGSADNQNILAAARLAAQYQKALYCDASLLPAHKLLEMITVVPAKMLRLNCGELTPGKDADLTIIDLTRPNLTPTTRTNVLENLIWASDGSEVRWVVANGVLVKDNYNFTTLDATEVLSEVQELHSLYQEYAKSARKVIGTGAHQE